MRPLLLLALICCLNVPLTAQDGEILSNKAIIDMVVGKLPKDLIILKVKGSKAAYDVSSSGLVALNAAKVPKEIIKLMMELPNGPVDRPAPEPIAEEPPPPPPAREAPPAAKGGPSAKTPARAPVVAPEPVPLRARKAALSNPPSEGGIHLRAEGLPLTMLEPARYDGSKVANALGSAITGGLSKAKMKATIMNAEASIRTSDASVEFYFIFEKSESSLGGASNAWFSDLSSPNEFRLLRLDKKESRREVTTASAGAFSAQSGTDEKAVVAFTFTRVKPGVYRVTPKEPLKPGEYAFFPPSVGGQGTAGAGMGKIFDFGVDER